jgi:GT2 family glycosyltransferase
MQTPFVSVIVCTRNRGDNVVHTARAVLASDYPHLELLVMDQSDDDSTRAALSPLLGQQSRLRYFKLDLPGKPRALNQARQEALGRYLALTDDDCEPAPDWIHALVAAFQTDPRIGCVFGDVAAGPYDPTLGCIYDNCIATSHTLTHLRDFWKVPDMVDFGLGANMAVRADVLAALQGWDPCVGPGAKFGSGDDHDLTVRALLTGYSIHFCAEARVTHFGFRTWEQAANDLRRMSYGQGAVVAKYLRCGTVYHGPLRMLRHALGQSLNRALHRQRPLGLAPPRSWMRGLIAGSHHPLDRHSRTFREVSGAASRAYGHQFAQVTLRAQQVVEQDSIRRSASSSHHQ